MVDGSQAAGNSGNPPTMLGLRVDGRAVEIADEGLSLLEVLRERLGIKSLKDGCSPQGQCGCCTVLVDGAPRVACVTPVRRVQGREITTLEGLPDDDSARWGEAFCATGASQCGFCTPGIVLRLEGLRRRGVAADDRPSIDRGLAAHLCRCTGWQTIHEAYAEMAAPAAPRNTRDLDGAERRAAIEGGSPQRVSAEVALGRGGFADDTAPDDALVAVLDGSGTWVVGETLSEARSRAGKVQGRRTTLTPTPPLEVPPGEWDRTLRTSWVEPAYLETDASWCIPGGEPSSPLANGGAFGGKVGSEVGMVARRLADEHGRAVRVLYAREDAVRLGPKRPPIAAGIDAAGSGVVRVVRTPGIADAIHLVAPALEVVEMDVPGPPTSTSLRGAGWVEALVLLDAARRVSDPDPLPLVAPNGSSASVEILADGTVRVRVACGDPLDEVVLRSYCIGAAHMALSWVTSEALVVDGGGEIHDLTMRSFGVLPSVAMPHVEVEIEPSAGPPVNGSDTVFAAVAAAVWAAHEYPGEWPLGAIVR